MREKEFMEMAKREILRQLPEDVRAGLSLKEVEVVKRFALASCVFSLVGVGLYLMK